LETFFEISEKIFYDAKKVSMKLIKTLGRARLCAKTI